MIHMVVIMMLSLVASLLFLYGWYGHNTILGSNQCKMTYSQPKKSPVHVKGYMGNYKLWKLSNSDSKKLNKHPIVFIPGHLGSVDQSRSFASYMHNDDNLFQYFALDFNDEAIALHGADILTKADFLNKAIEAIVSLYDQNSNSKDLKIGLLGHSYGGFIAKASMLLSNHPKKCLVKLIVMLGSPNLIPPFGPDATFSKLFFEVNKGWYQSFYSDKSKCPAKYIASDRIEMKPCSTCLTNVTVLSFTGGDIDTHIRPDVTNIFDISARPKNVTSIRLSSKSTSLVSLTLVSKFKKVAMNSLKYMFSPVLNLFSKSANDTITNSSISLSNASRVPVESEEPVPELKNLSDVEKINASSPFAGVTSERWFQDMAPYHDPHHISVRTSQMKDVGFMVDHYAILWCYQFVSKVNSAMKTILQKPFGIHDDFELHKILNIRNVENIENYTEEPSKLGISQLLNYIRRNETNNDFQAVCEVETNEMKNALNGNVFQLYAVQIFLRHTQKIPVALFNAGILALISTLLSLLLGERQSLEPISPLQSIMNVLDVRSFISLFNILLKYGTSITGSTVNCFGLFGIVVALLAWYFKWNFTHLEEGLSIVLALWVAVAIKMIVCIVILIVRSIFILVDSVGNLFGVGSRNIFQYFGRSFFWRWGAELLVFHVLLSVLIVNGLHYTILFESGTTASILILWLFGCNCLQLLVNIIAMGRKIGKHNQISDDLLYLHFLSVLCSIPSVLFAYNNIFIPQQTILFRTGIFDLFGVERINSLFTLFSMWLFSRNMSRFGSKLKVLPLNGFQLIIEPDPSKLKKECFHEDGGYKAIFEAIQPCNAQKQVCDGIVEGPTYKVVKCFCPTNRAFKSANEWCEWCRCPTCGYGKLINPAAANDDSDKPRLHLDMAVILVLGFALFYANYWGENKIFVLFYILGSVEFVLWIRLLFKKSTFVLQ